MQNPAPPSYEEANGNEETIKSAGEVKERQKAGSNAVMEAEEKVLKEGQRQVEEQKAEQKADIETATAEGNDDTMTLSRLMDIMNLVQCGHSDAVFCMEFSAPYMFTGGDDGMIVQWSLNTGFVESRIKGHVMGVTAMKVVGNKLYSVAQGNGDIMWYDFSSEQQGWMRGHTATVYCLIEVDGLLASSSEDRSFRFWDLTTNEQHGKHIQPAADYAVQVIYSSKSVPGSLFMNCGLTLACYSISSLSKKWGIDRHKSNCVQLHILESGFFQGGLASLGKDGFLHISDTTDGSLKHTFQPAGIINCFVAMAEYEESIIAMNILGKLMVFNNSTSTTPIKKEAAIIELPTENPNDLLVVNGVCCIASDEGLLHRYKVTPELTLETLESVKAAGKSINVLHYEESNQMLMCASMDGSIRSFSLGDGAMQQWFRSALKEGQKYGKYKPLVDLALSEKHEDQEEAAYKFEVLSKNSITRGKLIAEDITPILFSMLKSDSTESAICAGKAIFQIALEYTPYCVEPQFHTLQADCLHYSLLGHLDEYYGPLDSPKPPSEIPDKELDRDVLTEWSVCVVRALSADPKHRSTLGEIGYPKMMMDTIERYIPLILDNRTYHGVRWDIVDQGTATLWNMSLAQNNDNANFMRDNNIQGLVNKIRQTNAGHNFTGGLKRALESRGVIID